MLFAGHHQLQCRMQRALEKGLQWQRALQLLPGTQVRSVEPGIMSFHAACSALCEEGLQWQRALQLLLGTRVQRGARHLQVQCRMQHAL